MRLFLDTDDTDFLLKRGLTRIDADYLMKIFLDTDFTERHGFFKSALIRVNPRFKQYKNPCNPCLTRNTEQTFSIIKTKLN
jgi:hypothetical protein